MVDFISLILYLVSISAQLNTIPKELSFKYFGLLLGQLAVVLLLQISMDILQIDLKTHNRYSNSERTIGDDILCIHTCLESGVSSLNLWDAPGRA